MKHLSWSAHYEISKEVNWIPFREAFEGGVRRGSMLLREKEFGQGLKIRV